MKTHLSLLSILLAAPIAHGATFLIDFGDQGGTSRPAGTWNEYADKANINGSTMVDSGDGATNATLSYDGTITDERSNSSGTVLDVYDPSTTANPAWAAAAGKNGAASEYFYTQSAYTLIFGGLVAGGSVSLDALSSRNNSSAIGFYDYSLDGGATWLGFTVLNPDGSPATTDGWDTKNTGTFDATTNPLGQAYSLQSQGYTLHRYMNMSGTLAPGVSTLHVRTTKTGSFGGFNAMQLTANAVPEPSAAALLLLGAAAFISRRRR